MLSDNEEAVLNNLGLTLSQAKVYLALVKNGPSKASDIAQASKISREHLYPLLSSLEKHGFVEKELGSINIYIPTPLENVLSTLIRKRRSEIVELETKVKVLVESYERKAADAVPSKLKAKPEIKVTSSRQRSLNKAQKHFEDAKFQIDLMHTWKRFMQFWGVYEETLRDVMDKGVKVRQLVDLPPDEEKAEHFLNKEIFANCMFELRFVKEAGGNFAVLDNERTFMSSTLSMQDLAKTPLLFSNYEGFVGLTQSYFEISWKTAYCWSPTMKVSEGMYRHKNQNQLLM